MESKIHKSFDYLIDDLNLFDREWKILTDDGLISSKILTTFMVDLLGMNTLPALIFKQKLEIGYNSMKAVSLWQKIFGYLVCSTILLYGVYNSYLVVAQGELCWQVLVLNGVLLQVIAQVVVLESLSTWFLHYIVPSLYASEIRRVWEILNPLLVKFNLNKPFEDFNVLMDVPAHFYPSVIMAKSYPNSVETRFITSYHTYLLNNMFQFWHSSADFSALNAGAWKHPIVDILLYLKNWFGYMYLNQMDLLEFGASTTVSVLLLLVVFTMSYLPIMTIFAVFVVIIIWGVIYKYFFRVIDSDLVLNLDQANENSLSTNPESVGASGVIELDMRKKTTATASSSSPAPYVRHVPIGSQFDALTKQPSITLKSTNYNAESTRTLVRRHSNTHNPGMNVPKQISKVELVKAQSISAILARFDDDADIDFENDSNDSDVIHDDDAITAAYDVNRAITAKTLTGPYLGRVDMSMAGVDEVKIGINDETVQAHIKEKAIQDILNKCIRRDNETLEEYEIRKIFKLPVHLLTSNQLDARNRIIDRQNYKQKKRNQYHEMEVALSQSKSAAPEQVSLFIKKYLSKGNNEVYSDLSSSSEEEGELKRMNNLVANNSVQPLHPLLLTTASNRESPVARNASPMQNLTTSTRGEGSIFSKPIVRQLSHPQSPSFHVQPHWRKPVAPNAVPTNLYIEGVILGDSNSEEDTSSHHSQESRVSNSSLNDSSLVAESENDTIVNMPADSVDSGSDSSDEDSVDFEQLYSDSESSFL